MSDQVAPDTFTYTLAGREMTLLTTSNGQRLMIQRRMRRMRDELDRTVDTDPKQWEELFEKLEHFTWDIVETKFINPDDLEFVEKQILAGKVDINEAYSILSNGVRRKAAQADDADPAPAKPRGRKAPAKKPAKLAKKTAAPRRVTR